MPKRIISTPTNPDSKRITASSSNVGENTIPVSSLSLIPNDKKTANDDLLGASANLDRSFSQLSLASNLSTYDPAIALGGTRHGPERDLLEIDILSVDGNEVRTNFTESEIYMQVLRQTLGLRRSQINNVWLGWLGHQYIQVKLKEKVRVNDYAGFHEFLKPGVDSEGKAIQHKIKFEVRGHREAASRDFKPESDDDPWVRWVKIESTGLKVEKHRIRSLLEKFGELHSNISEILIEFRDQIEGDDDDADDLIQLGTGKFEVKMLIETHIPQYIPAFGRKVKIHYRGIEKLCTNCYSSGHYRADCSNEKMDYVCWFRSTYPEIGPEILGRWSTLASIHQRKKLAAHSQNSSMETIVRVGEPHPTQQLQSQSDANEKHQQPEESGSQSTRFSRRTKAKPQPTMGQSSVSVKPKKK